MYDHLAGEITDSQPARVVVHVAGVGYEVKVPTSTSSRLKAGDRARLYTILHVVDGTPQLIGFAERAERGLARRLLGVQGVGPSMCLALLSTLTPHQIAAAIAEGDVAALKRVKGVGAKTAERLCLELREVVAKLGWLDGDAAGPGSPAAEAAAAAGIGGALGEAEQDAVAGLLTLGFTEKEARKKVEAIARGEPGVATEELIRRVLQSS